jgi:hypothetical protein
MLFPLCIPYSRLLNILLGLLIENKVGTFLQIHNGQRMEDVYFPRKTMRGKYAV